MIKKTLFNILSLPIGILISIGLVWILVKLFPSQSNEGWGGVGDMLTFSVFVPILSALFSVGWTVKVVYDLLKYKNNRKFFWYNLSVLTLPYSVLLYFLFAFLFQQGKEFLQRESVTIKVEQYDSLLYPKNYHIKDVARANDSILLYMESNKKSNSTTPIVYAIYKNNKYQDVKGLFDNLNLFCLKDNRIVLIQDKGLSDSLLPNGLVLIKIKENQSCISYYGSLNENHIIVSDTCNLVNSDTIFGFEADNHGAGPITYTGKDGRTYFLFCTEPSTYYPTCIFIAEIYKKRKRVYKINLKEPDRPYFDPRQIVTIFNQNSKFYILSHKKIIWFNMEKQQ
ncbi:MAG: hypothetical protein SFY56_08780 [Bacteroidota bacterium]|nr:hypothetical protein [Bacteroidota bacterium]